MMVVMGDDLYSGGSGPLLLGAVGGGGCWTEARRGI